MNTLNSVFKKTGLNSHDGGVTGHGSRPAADSKVHACEGGREENHQATGETGQGWVIRKSAASCSGLQIELHRETHLHFNQDR